VQKTSNFSEIVVSRNPAAHTDKGGIEPGGHFSERCGSQFFSIMCRRLIWTAPNQERKKSTWMARPSGLWF